MRPQPAARPTNVQTAGRMPLGAGSITRAVAVLALGALFSVAAAVPGREAFAQAAPASAGAGGKTYHTRFKVDAADGIREVDIEGRVRFSADESRVEWMGEGAYLHLVTSEDGRKVRFDAEPDGQGRPVVQFRIDGRALPFDEAAERRLAGSLPIVFRELGHNAEARVQAAYAEGGAAAVFRMISAIRSDNATRLHYDAFLKRKELADAEVIGALSRAGEDFHADTELAMFLYGAADLYRERPGIRGAYLACLADFDSDFERLRLTRNLFGVEAIPDGQQPTINMQVGDC